MQDMLTYIFLGTWIFSGSTKKKVIDNVTLGYDDEHQVKANNVILEG